MADRGSILISGASTGLGRGMAIEFAARSRDLALCARRVDLLEQLRDELTDRHPDIRIVIRQLDVTDHEAVFEVFRELDCELGGIDRVIVNAGSRSGRPLGTGAFETNRVTAETNVIGSLAQSEAALELFRARSSGHLVLISSVSALRGFPRNLTAYAASKASVRVLGEGIRADLAGTPITVSVIMPGYIATSGATAGWPVVSLEKGCRLLVRAIEREPARAYVPRWPWSVAAVGMRLAPLGIVGGLSAGAQRVRA